MSRCRINIEVLILSERSTGPPKLVVRNRDEGRTLPVYRQEVTMLILTRKPDQALIIGENIVVRVLGVAGGQVKIGIEAPREVTVLRDELHDQPPD